MQPVEVVEDVVVALRCVGVQGLIELPVRDLSVPVRVGSP